MGERIGIHEAYRQTRERVGAFARGLGDDEAATPVPALPGWTVKDTFAHLAGLATDVVGGNLPEGVPSEEFTQREVDERANASLRDVLDEWDRTGPEFEAILAALGEGAPPNPPIDVWTHEVDVRSALGVTIPADGGLAERILEGMVRRGLGRGWAERGLPALRIVADADEWVAGDGDPAGTLRTTMFELSRVLLGRRSPSQMAALGWEGVDPAPWIAAIPVFGPARTDVVDSARA